MTAGESHYGRCPNGFAFHRSEEEPTWRRAQRGALAGLLAHWTVHDSAPALLSLPTGAGKSAIATALPYLRSASRVLVLVPSKQLRAQMAEAFRSEVILRQVGAIAHLHEPRVVELSDRNPDWAELVGFDVVVAIPSSLSPAYVADPPESDFFDLVIVDEAHHAPAPTWQLVLDHHHAAHRVLLTATPKRRDGKRVPGEIAFHYPLGLAIADGTYQQVRAEIIEIHPDADRDACDRAVATRALEILADDQHATSTFLVRASSTARVNDLAALYSDLGRELAVLTSRTPSTRQEQIIAGLRDGTIRSVAVVGMLGEGFDLPSLRVAAYHDKHKSLAPTIQLIGRLVRSHKDYPQPSVLVSARDIDVFPSLQGAVRELYEEDADWGKLLPGIIDDEIVDAIASREFASSLPTPPPELSVESLVVPVRAIVYEARSSTWEPDMRACLEALGPTSRIRGGHEVFYSALTADARSIVVITQRRESPQWHAHTGLDSVRFDLHVVTWAPPRPKQYGLLLSNTESGDVTKHIFELLVTDDAELRRADPDRMQDAFDALPRVSVSNVGVRNTYAGSKGTASYKTFAGSGVDRGMREGDTAQGAIGHAMAQVSRTDGSGAYNVGIAVEKAKFWESRPVPLRLYDDVMTEFAERYWSATRGANPLLPDVARGAALTAFPPGPTAFTELHPDLLGQDWRVDGQLLENADIRAVVQSSTEIELGLRWDPDDEEAFWVGRQGLDGRVTSVGGDVLVHHGFSAVNLTDLLTDSPVSIYMADGRTVIGTTLYGRPQVNRSLARIRHREFAWTGANIEKETDRSAEEAGQGISVQAYVTSKLLSATSAHQHRWILHNDGKGEIADLILLELDDGGPVRAEFWHVKPSGGSGASVRVTDLEVVLAQAAKSRRWFTDAGLWDELARRLNGLASPPLRIMSGDPDRLRTLLAPASEQDPWTLVTARPTLQGEIVIAQPGLSWGSLVQRLQTDDLAAIQIRDLLSVCNDAVGALADTVIVGSA